MNKHTIGFSIFFFLLLVAPELAVPGVGTSNSNISMGAFGLALWFLLSAGSLGFRNTYTLGPIVGLLICGCYFLLISLFSLNLMSIAYVLQFFYYIFTCCLLMPAFLDHRMKQERLASVCNVVAWIGIIYISGLFVSLWTGPLYPEQVGAYVKRYDDLEVARAVGFSSSVSLAGGVAAFLAAFFLFLYPRHEGRCTTLFAMLSLLGLLASLSRSALVAFSSALLALAGLRILRFALVRGGGLRDCLGGSHLALRLALAFLLAGLAGTSYLAFDEDMRQTVFQGARGIGVDQAVAENDIDGRIVRWNRGLGQWLEKTPWQQAFGVGFRNNSGISGNTGAFVTSHNFYIELLNDFGILGTILFFAPILTVLSRLCVRILARGGDPITHFCFVATTSLVVHNLTQVFFYHPSMISLLVFLLALASLHLRRRRHAVAIERALPSSDRLPSYASR